jgi:acetyl-CoA acetyltransferase
VERGATRLGGRLPINVSGGLHSKDHPIGATGAIQIRNLAVQLRGEAGASQVQGAQLGLAENGGGFYGLEEAACVVTILEAPNR